MKFQVIWKQNTFENFVLTRYRLKNLIKFFIVRLTDTRNLQKWNAWFWEECCIKKWIKFSACDFVTFLLRGKFRLYYFNSRYRSRTSVETYLDDFSRWLFLSFILYMDENFKDHPKITIEIKKNHYPSCNYIEIKHTNNLTDPERMVLEFQE